MYKNNYKSIKNRRPFRVHFDNTFMFVSLEVLIFCINIIGNTYPYCASRVCQTGKVLFKSASFIMFGKVNLINSKCLCNWALAITAVQYECDTKDITLSILFLIITYNYDEIVSFRTSGLIYESLNILYSHINRYIVLKNELKKPGFTAVIRKRPGMWLIANTRVFIRL